MNVIVPALTQVALFNVSVGVLATQRHVAFDDFRVVVHTASRVSSMVMTSFIGLTALYSVLKYPNVPQSDDADVPDDQRRCLSMFLGYMIGDSVVMALCAAMDDPPHISNVVHHAFCVFASLCILASRNMAVYMSFACRVMLFELSSPFLNAAWICKKTKSPREPACVAATWVTFLVFRVINGATVVYHMSSYALVWFYFMICFYLLNIVWFAKLTMYAVKHVL